MPRRPNNCKTLAKVADAESALKKLGFRQLRVRHYGELARLELEQPDLTLAVARRDEVVAAVKTAGYRYVTLDLEGFRSGNLNGSLSGDAGAGKVGSRRDPADSVPSAPSDVPSVFGGSR